MITRALYDKFHKLATMARFTNEDARELQAAIQMYINPSYSVCLRCVQQLRHGQKIINNWLSTQQIIEDLPQVREENVLEMVELPEPDVDIVEAEKVGCTKCSRKKKIKS
jgi:hypothetical protein